MQSLATGQSLRRFCIANRLPYASVWELLNPVGGDNSAYARAREVGTHYLADECLDIADNLMEDAHAALLDVLKTAREYAGVDPALLDAMGVQPPQISDLVSVAKVRIDTRKRLIGKWNPKVYGDRQTLAGDDENPLKMVHQVERIIVRPAHTDG